MMKLISLLAIFATSLATILAAGSTAHAAVDPDTSWKTIETPHFSLIFDSKQQRIAQIYALRAEQAFAALTPSFGVWPEKTVIYLDDSTDVANGSATPWPYPLITAYPVLPLTNDVIGAYGDWGLELLTHEYTHILNFTPANGIMKPLRFVFGSIIAPNGLLPRWYSEGLAVEMETRYSKFGRLRSGTFLSIARALSLEGKLRNEDISRINESIPDFPGGNRPYLMGALVWDELTRRAGDKIIGELNTAYSRRIPFFLDGPLQDRLQIGWRELLDDVYARVETRVAEQIARINAPGKMSESAVARAGYYTHSPSLSPNGNWLAFVAQNLETDPSVMLMKRPFSGVTPENSVASGSEINKVSWLPDSTGFVYDAVDAFDRYYAFSDLYVCTLQDNGKCRTKKITKGLRAREPAVSPDGRKIIFVQNTPGSTRLAVVDIDGANERPLLEPPMQTRLSSPTFVSQDEIVFSERLPDGIETLRYATLQPNDQGQPVIKVAPLVILKDFAPARLPSMTTKGLTFVSDVSGISNLYLADRAMKTARALTNTETRVLDGTLDPVTGHVLYGRLEAAGAALFDADPATVPAAPPRVDALIDTSYPSLNPPQIKPSLEITDYHPSHWLLPKYWFPYAYVLPGGVFAQASTAAFDPLGRHSYSLTAAFDTLSRKPSVFGSYTNATTRVPITLAAQNITEYLYSTGLTRQTTAGSITGSFFLPSLSNKWRGLLGWEYLQTDAGGFLTVRNGADAGVAYTNFSQRGNQISPETGGAASVTHRHYFDSLGNIGYDETDASVSKYISWLLPEHHALAFFANAAWAPALSRTLLGRSTVGGSHMNGVIQNAFVMRGYDSGVFLGKDMLTLTAEYRFPLAYSYRGMGTLPFFLRRLHAGLFCDAITLDGVSYSQPLGAYLRESFGTFHLGTGAELKFDTTVFYSLPAQIVLGAYYGVDQQLNPKGLFPFFGLNL